MFNGILFSIIETSLIISVIYLLLFFLKPLISQKLVVKWYYWVYLIMFVRLLIPINITIPQAPVQIELPERMITATPSGFDFKGSIIIQPEQTSPVITAPIPDTSVNVLDTKPSVIQNEPTSVSVYDIIAIIYGSGILFFIGYQAICYFILKHRLKVSSVLCEEDDLSARLAAVKSEMGINNNISVYLCSVIKSPMIAGLKEPVLLLPVKDYNNEELSFIFRHELIHLKRGDLWYKLLMLVANALHWVNPVVYLMRSECSKILEITCDGEVVKDRDLAFKKRYCNVIADSVEIEKKEQKVYLSTSFNGDKKTLKQRFAFVFDMKKRRNGIVSIIALLFLTLTIGMLFACGIKEEDPVDSIEPVDVLKNIEPKVEAAEVIEPAKPTKEEEIETLLNKYFQLEADFRTKGVKMTDADFIELNAYMYLHSLAVEEMTTPALFGKPTSCSYEFTVSKIEETKEGYTVTTKACMLPVNSDGVLYDDFTGGTFIFKLKYIENELKIVEIITYESAYRTKNIYKLGNVAYEDLTLEMIKTGNFSIDYSHSYPKTELSIIEKETQYQTVLANNDEYINYIKLCKPETVNYYKELLAMTKKGDNVYLLARISSPPEIYDYKLYLFKIFIKDGYVAGEVLDRIGLDWGFSAEAPENPVIYYMEPTITKDDENTIIFGRQPWQTIGKGAGTYTLTYAKGKTEQYGIDDGGGFIGFYEPAMQLEKLTYSGNDGYICEYHIENDIVLPKLDFTIVGTSVIVYNKKVYICEINSDWAKGYTFVKGEFIGNIESYDVFYGTGLSAAYVPIGTPIYTLNENKDIILAETSNGLLPYKLWKEDVKLY